MGLWASSRSERPPPLDSGDKGRTGGLSFREQLEGVASSKPAQAQGRPREQGPRSQQAVAGAGCLERNSQSDFNKQLCP